MSKVDERVILMIQWGFFVVLFGERVCTARMKYIGVKILQQKALKNSFVVNGIPLIHQQHSKKLHLHLVIYCSHRSVVYLYLGYTQAEYNPS
jgi:late competence protein required for DNA uptake (superfamily II DNA/RNA helicase)